MTDRAQIAEMLRGLGPRVISTRKHEFEVGLKTPITVRLKKDGVHIDQSGRVIDYKDAASYFKGLLNMGTTEGSKWDRNTRKKNMTILMNLFADRVVPKSRKESSFQLDRPEQPTTVYLSNTGEVKIEWAASEGKDPEVNMYQFDDVVQHLTEYGPEFQSDGKRQLTMREQEERAKAEAEAAKAKRKKGRAKKEPAPAPEPVVLSEEKQYWHHPESDSVVATKPGTNVQPYLDQGCVEISKKKYRKLHGKGKHTYVLAEPKPDKPRKRRTGPSKPRGKGLGVGGNPLTGKDRKRAEKAIQGLKENPAVRLLINDFDADNDTIVEMVGVEDKVVQRNRRAILRAQRDQ